MGRFYETTVFAVVSGQPGRLRSSGIAGWQVLASPPEVNGERIAYETLLDDLGVGVGVGQVGGFMSALAIVGDPTVDYGATVSLSPSGNARSRLSLAEVDRLANQTIFAAETSPLQARTLLDLGAVAATSVVVSIGELPAIVLVGEAIGLVVIRGLAAVGGALWEGA
jgi:hypothetical protein